MTEQDTFDALRRTPFHTMYEQATWDEPFDLTTFLERHGWTLEEFKDALLVCVNDMPPFEPTFK